MYLDVMNGTLRCGECFGQENDVVSCEAIGQTTVILPLSPAVLGALRYVIGSPAKRVFSFRLPEEAIGDFCRVTEKYLAHQLERGFRTLTFYHRVRALEES